MSNTEKTSWEGEIPLVDESNDGGQAANTGSMQKEPVPTAPEEPRGDSDAAMFGLPDEGPGEESEADEKPVQPSPPPPASMLPPEEKTTGRTLDTEPAVESGEEHASVATGTGKEPGRDRTSETAVLPESAAKSDQQPEEAGAAASTDLAREEIVRPREPETVEESATGQEGPESEDIGEDEVSFNLDSEDVSIPVGENVPVPPLGGDTGEKTAFGPEPLKEPEIVPEPAPAAGGAESTGGESQPEGTPLYPPPAIEPPRQSGGLAAIIGLVAVAGIALVAVWMNFRLSNQVTALETKIKSLQSARALAHKQDRMIADLNRRLDALTRSLEGKRKVSNVSNKNKALPATAIVPTTPVASPPEASKTAATKKMGTAKEVNPPSTAKTTEVAKTAAGTEPASKKETQGTNKTVATPGIASGGWFINLTSQRRRKDALDDLARFKRSGLHGVEIVAVNVQGKKWYRTRLPGFRDAKTARSRMHSLEKKLGLHDMWISRK